MTDKTKIDHTLGQCEGCGAYLYESDDDAGEMQSWDDGVITCKEGGPCHSERLKDKNDDTNEANEAGT